MHPLQDSVRPKHKHFPLPKPTSEKALQSRSFGQVYAPSSGVRDPPYYPA
jgi:hypothetical protein